MANKYVYVWNGILEVGGNDAYYNVFSSRKKAIKYAIEKCEKYGYIEPQVTKKLPSLTFCTSIVDYQDTYLGVVKRIEIS